MILEVKKGSHRFRPSWPRLVFRKHMSYTVTFLPSCRYDIGADQGDWNKLFGVGKLSWRAFLELFIHLAKWIKPNWFDWLKVPHHKESYRTVWRYNIDLGKIEVGAYWYDDGIRHVEIIGSCRINELIELGLLEILEMIHWKVNGFSRVITPGKWPSIGYKLGAYFGGNRPAPHDIKIEMK